MASFEWRLLGALSLIVVCLTLASCGPGGTTAVPGAGVTGSVTLDGKPMPAGWIEFAHPESPETEKLTINDGKYSGNAPVALCAVRITNDVDGKENTVATKWNYEGSLKANVTEDASANVFDYKVTSK